MLKRTGDFGSAPEPSFALKLMPVKFCAVALYGVGDFGSPTRLKPKPAPQFVNPEPLTCSAYWSHTAVPPDDSTVMVSMAPDVASLNVSHPPVRPSCGMTAGIAAVPSSK